MAALALALALAIAAPAQAAPGDLVGQSCISKTGAGGCAVLPPTHPNVLESPAGVVVAPDGTDIYVGSGQGITHFRRAPDGAVTYANCVDVISSAVDRCPTTDAPADAGSALSANSIHLAMSPDGKHLYAVSWADALLWWTRNPTTGDLTWGGCRDAAINSSSNNRCGTGDEFAEGNFPAGSMDFVQGIAITPDGQTIYIADQTEGLLQAQRNATTGVVTPTACFNNTGSAVAGCASVAADIPMALGAIDAASNSRDVYVRSISPGGIAHFSRTAGGSTSFTSCVAASSPTASCATAGAAPIFSNSGSLAVVGDTVFTYGGTNLTPSGTAARFTRNPNGSLSFGSCATNEASPGPCAALPAQIFGSSLGRLLVSPDASSVYLPQNGTSERALTRLTGALALGSCLSDTGVAACSAPPLPTPFQASGLMARSPDGTQIYQAGADTLNVYAVEQPASGSGAPPATPVTVPKPRPRAKKPRIRSIKRLANGRYRVKVRVFEAGRISARFTGRLKPKGRVKTIGGPVGKRARKPGIHTIGLKPSALARERKVKAKLIVRIAPPGYVPARRVKAVRLK
jgi:DNA-binding beta-propeller fold protein YncE